MQPALARTVRKWLKGLDEEGKPFAIYNSSNLSIELVELIQGLIEGGWIISTPYQPETFKSCFKIRGSQKFYQYYNSL